MKQLNSLIRNAVATAPFRGHPIAATLKLVRIPRFSHPLAPFRSRQIAATLKLDENDLDQYRDGLETGKRTAFGLRHATPAGQPKFDSKIQLKAKNRVTPRGYFERLGWFGWLMIAIAVVRVLTWMLK